MQIMEKLPQCSFHNVFTETELMLETVMSFTTRLGNSTLLETSQTLFQMGTLTLDSEVSTL